MAVSFDLFDTLVTADRPSEPWSAVTEALEACGICVSERQEAHR